MLEGLENFKGPAAGVATSVLWTATSLLFTAAGRRIGPTSVNATRIALAILLLGGTHRLLAETWIPGAEARQVAFLALSGVIGLAIGDQALFTSYMYIGPRLAMLVMTTGPLFAALFGWLALGEMLAGLAWIGIALTIGGVAWVVLERPPAETRILGARRLRGVLLAFVATACQAGGYLLSKQGMGHGWLPEGQRMDPQAATLIRMLFAGIGMIPILALHRTRERRRRRAGIVLETVGARSSGYALAACGAVVGPFLGVWLSLVAADRAPLGVAQTLCSLPPVFILPFAVWLHKERISPRAVIGAIVAVAGVALLFVKPA